ncbi:phosphotransferase enzyme family-domain-containing protein [Rhypophila decipiens]|uniref:Phosphotransferase enzyme family-domain-containing protein n=1 Tax=Rhypophila decipiens TaxID=261697 RepID=A0AAN7B2B7_9PEZI|nr:phosphotransferase enzyme family-domain-containing protein [Rhypophila decipiens]
MSRTKVTTKTAWDRYLPEDRVRYTGWQPWNSEPFWPSEPDSDAIKAIFVSEFFSGSDHHNDPDLQVRFFAEGSHHKVYEATHPSWTQPYLLRVALGVDPCLKTESEMATLAYLRHKTTIPVPKPIAWISGVDARIGYEWSLEEKVPGVVLESVWRKMPWDKKVNLVRQVARMMEELWRHKFNKVGSLYVTQAQTNNSSSALSVRPRHVRLEDMVEPQFFVGPTLEYEFGSGRRHYLSTTRGPFNNTRDWLEAHTEVERAHFQSAKALLDEAPAALLKDQEEWENLVAEEIAFGIDTNDFLGLYDRYIENCDTCLRLLPKLYPEDRPSDTKSTSERPCGLENHSKPTSEQYFLNHQDLNDTNILVDPETFAITGIIDWERSGVYPAWHSVGYPKFISEQDPSDKGEPPIPETYDEEDDNYKPIPAEERIEWEAMKLRQEFDKQLVELGCTSKPGPLSLFDTVTKDVLGRICELGTDLEYWQNMLNDVHEKLAALEQERNEIADLERVSKAKTEALRQTLEEELRDFQERQNRELEGVISLYERMKEEIKQNFVRKRKLENITA